MFVFWLIVIPFLRNVNPSGAWLFQNVKWKLEEKPLIMKLGGCKKNTKKKNKAQKQKRKAPNVVIWAFLLFYLSFSLQHNMCLLASVTTKLLLPLPTKLGTWLAVFIGNNSKREGGHFPPLLMVFCLVVGKSYFHCHYHLDEKKHCSSNKKKKRKKKRRRRWNKEKKGGKMKGKRWQVGMNADLCTTVIINLLVLPQT